MNAVFFHNPDEQNGYLSNWYLSAFTCDGVTFSSLEQYMMYRKAVCFHDEKSASEILKSADPARIKMLGRGVSGYQDHVWNGMRQIIVYEGALAKFGQDKDLKRLLLGTEDAILAG